MKKRVGIIYSGQMRANSLNPYYTNDNIILEATQKYLLNDEFKNKYDYDVFFSVDDINEVNAKEFFGDNLKNIHITEIDYYMSPIDENIPSYEYFHNNYLINTNRFNDYNRHIHAVYQYYRMYCSYKLLKNYQKRTNTKYDILIRIRPDIRLMQNVVPLIDIIESGQKTIIMEHEQLCILDYKLENMFNLIEKYGTYQKHIDDKIDIYLSFLTSGNSLSSDYIMRFCPEKQFTDHVYYTVLEQNLNFNDSFYGLIYPSFNLLYRGNNKYGYIENSHPLYNDTNYIWEPISKIKL